MNKYFKKFRETGKISDYLKYKEELAKENSEEKRNEDSKNKRASDKKP